MSKISPYYKAIAGFVGAAIVAYFGVQAGGVTGQEWLEILVAGIGGSGLVYAAPKNTPRAPKGDAGNVDVLLLLSVLTFVGVLLLLFRVRF